MAATDESFDPVAARDFAVDTVRRLRGAGFTALFAGGCVRDELLGQQPKDFDVASDARPEAVQALFGKRRTIAVGAAFGVVERIGTRRTGHVQIATFRSDGTYTDGRRPDSVVYSSPEEDARRRDFTINGMFLDPTTDEVLDYVGGRADLADGVIRAIGDPRDRIAEDKLRMLRGPRFAARYGFRLDAATAAAIRATPTGLRQVSPERIADEMRRMLAHPSRALAIRMLADLGLWTVVIAPAANPGDPAAVDRTLAVLGRLPRTASDPVAASGDTSSAGPDEPPLTTVLAAALRAGGGWTVPPASPPDRDAVKRLREPAVEQAARWRLSNVERDDAAYLLVAEQAFRAASAWPWPDVQPLAAHPLAGEAVRLARALHAVGDDDPPGRRRLEAEGLVLVAERLAWPAGRLDPPPLLTGADLKRLGVPAGPVLGRLLESLRREQLDGRIRDRDQAEDWVRRQIGRPE